jgi:hypothetical protein
MTRLKDDCPDDIFEIGFSLNTLAYDEPEKAWSAIKIIIDAMDRRGLIEGGDDDLRKLASNLGAGPLETLIAQHGNELIEKIEDRASKDDRTAWILGCVWQNAIPDKIWTRVRKAAGGVSR